MNRNTNAPDFIDVQNYRVEVWETIPPGTHIIQVNASDADSNDVCHFLLIIPCIYGTGLVRAVYI